NFYRRIEVVFPIEDGNLRERVISELLTWPLRDNVKARIMDPDGAYHRPPLKRGEAPQRSQMEFIDRALRGPGPGRRGGKSKTKYPQVKLAPRPKLPA
ncbi:MAG TPA: RNA degradosome polyphosphate kinase, partial [Verrucomicrobiae bacterium]|nr:RNA degradosome polyphosphate kinase [Verrucomicrobiae bacterium]